MSSCKGAGKRNVDDKPVLTLSGARGKCEGRVQLAIDRLGHILSAGTARQLRSLLSECSRIILWSWEREDGHILQHACIRWQLLLETRRARESASASRQDNASTVPA